MTEIKVIIEVKEEIEQKDRFVLENKIADALREMFLTSTKVQVI